MLESRNIIGIYKEYFQYLDVIIIILKIFLAGFFHMVLWFVVKGGNGVVKNYRQEDGKYNASGLRIRLLRESMGLSQEQLAAQLQLMGLDITQKTVSRIETGNRIITDYEIIFFSKFFHVSADELLDIKAYK